MIDWSLGRKIIRTIHVLYKLCTMIHTDVNSS